MSHLLIWTDPLTESNCYVLAQGGACVVIDPNHPQGPARLLREHGLTPRWLLLTHEHCDHMAGLEALREAYPAARVLCSAACSEGIQDKHRNMTAMMEVYLTFRGKPGVRYPPFTCRPADVTYRRRHTLRWRGHTLVFTALPGHTPGSACILLDGKTLFSGDYLIPGQDVITRLPGGSQADYDKLARPWLAALEPGLQICPGHGQPYTLTKEALRHAGL